MTRVITRCIDGVELPEEVCLDIDSDECLRYVVHRLDGQGAVCPEPCLDIDDWDITDLMCGEPLEVKRGWLGSAIMRKGVLE